MDFDIIDKIYTDVNGLITEELGIADNVKNNVDVIYDMILENAKSAEKSIIYDGTSVRSGNFNIEFASERLTVFYTLINFKDNGFRQKFIEIYGDSYLDSKSNFFYSRSGKRIRLIMNSISIAIESISGTIQNTANIKDSIQHELEHIYQPSMMDKEFGGSQLYHAAAGNLYSSNKSECYLANVIYMSFKSEIEGFANGLYAFVIEAMKNGNLNVSYQFRQSEAFKKLQIMYEAKDYIAKNIDSFELLDALSKYNAYGINKGNIIDIADKTIKQMVRRFGRTLIKVKKDLASRGGIRGGRDVFEMKFNFL